MDLEFFLQEEALEKKCKDEVLADLQKEAECGKVNLNEVSGAYFREKVNEKMKKMSYLKELERSFGEPQPLSDGRYGWRVNGRKGYFPRGKSIEEVYDKQWKYFLEELEKQKEPEFCQIPFEDIIDRFNKEKIEQGKNSNTVNSWKAYVRFYLSNEELKRPIGSFTKKELTDLYVKAICTKTPVKTTVNNARSATRKYVRYAENMLNLKLQFSAEELNEALLEATPEEKLTKKQPIQLFVDSTEDYSNQEAKAFVKEALDRGTLIAYESVVSFFTNERPSEITGLLAENVDLEKGLIFIRTRMVRNNTNHSYEETAPKGGKFRTIVIPTIALPIFKKVAEMRNPESKFFFAEMENNHKRENVDNKRLGRQIESICKAIGMESVKSGYDQRRTYVKILDSIALPTALRKILMGHELDKLENAYMKSIELSIAEARAYIDPGFKKFFGVNNIFELKEA